MNIEDFATQQLGKVNNLYNEYSSPDWMNRMNSLLQNLYGVQARNLFGQQQRDMTSGANQGLAQASAMNLSNPYTMVNRGLSNVGQEYAGAYGNLASTMAQQQANLPLERAKILGSILGIGSQYGSMLPEPSNLGATIGGTVGRLGLTGLGYLAGGLPGAFIGSQVLR